MPTVAVVTIVTAVILALVIASYLLRVVFLLRSVNNALSKTTHNVRVIAGQTSLLSDTLVPVKADIQSLADILDDVYSGLRTTEPVV